MKARTLKGRLVWTCAVAAMMGLAAYPALAIEKKGTDFAGKTAIERPIIDDNSIDVMSGRFTRTDTFLVLGDPAAGGLKWSYSSHDADFILTDEYTGKITLDNSITVDSGKTKVSVSGAADSFKKGTGGTAGACTTTCINTLARSSTLVKSGTQYIYSTTSGDLYYFDAFTGSIAPPYTGTIARLASIQYANGAVITINYDEYPGCTPKSVGCQYRIKSVVSSAGYAFKYEYTTGNFFQLTKISALNLGNIQCDPAVLNCSSYHAEINLSYPTVSGQTYVVQITAPDGNAYQYGIDDTNYWDIPTLDYVKLPSGAIMDVNYDNFGRATSYTDPRGTWTYAYSDTNLDLINSADGRDTTVTNPDGTVWGASFRKGAQLPLSQYDELNRTTTYTLAQIPSGGFVVGTVTRPEGDKSTFTYDARGNLTSTTETPKVGSGQSATTTYSNFDTTCGNQKTCNKPNWTQDARGNKTYYTYDPTHGGVLTVTSPAVVSPVDGVTSVTPKVINTYTYLPTYRYGGGSNFIQMGNLYKLTESSTCSTATTCDGTVNQLKTSYTYVNANLLPITETKTTGNAVGTPGYLTVTTTSAYDPIGNIIQIDGPRTDVDDNSYFTYDGMRRKIFEISVDPDAGSGLKRQVTKHYYNVDGKEWKTEFGTGNATNGSDFVVSYFKRVTFDAAGREIKSEMVQP